MTSILLPDLGDVFAADALPASIAPGDYSKEVLETGWNPKSDRARPLSFPIKDFAGRADLPAGPQSL